MVRTAAPSGTLTFLFTDIEGSTKLWDTFPAAMTRVLERHDELLRTTIESKGGYVFKTIGDAFCAAFPSAPDAVDAARTIQEALAVEPWGEVGTIRVRIALHTGDSAERDGDYFGPTLNRVARVLALGYGGQVLITAATAELVRTGAGAPAELDDLGDHRLRDLTRPEHIFALPIPALGLTFGPLRSVATVPTNVPSDLASMVGRERDVAELRHALATSRLVTITGGGGIGKTRIAVQVANELVDTFADGVWFVELAAIAEAPLLPAAIATVLSVREEGGKTLTQSIVDSLREKRGPLVLDGCEHLLAACAELTAALVRYCPHLRVLISSREPLGIAGEFVHRIGTLSIPPPNELMLSRLLTYESVQLFIERARAAAPAFEVNERSAAPLASICRRLDGIPLAIELAAARVKMISIEEISRRLDDRFRLLTSGSRTAIARQRTLKAAIDWSYDLLAEPERVLFARLGGFSGGWTLDAAETVCADAPLEPFEVLDLLSACVDKSLVASDTHGEAQRYRLLETMREYALERLTERNEGAALRLRHTDYFAKLALDSGSKSSSERWTELEFERENLRAALAHLLDSGENARALDMVNALSEFWIARGHFMEGKAALERVLAHAPDDAQNAAGIRALHSAGSIAYHQGDYGAAETFYQRELELARALGEQRACAQAANGLGTAAYGRGDDERARALYEESLTLFRACGDDSGVARVLNNLGILAINRMDFAQARELYDQCLALFRARGDERRSAWVLTSLGRIEYFDRNFERARTLVEEGLAIQRTLEDRLGVAESLSSLGEIALEAGDATAARQAFASALSCAREIGSKTGVIAAIEGAGRLSALAGDPAEGLRLLAAGRALRAALGAPLQPPDRPILARAMELAAAPLESAASEAAQRMGEHFTLDDAAAAAATALA